jgi:hypothetical protein
MADPGKLGGVFEIYAAKLQADPAYKGLLARMEQGDRGAANELQQLVANEAWGGRKSCVLQVDVYGVVSQRSRSMMPISRSRYDLLPC